MPRIVLAIVVASVVLAIAFGTGVLSFSVSFIDETTSRVVLTALLVGAALALWRGTPASITVARGLFGLTGTVGLAFVTLASIFALMGGLKGAALIGFFVVVPAVLTAALFAVVVKLGREDVQGWALERSFAAVMDD